MISACPWARTAIRFNVLRTWKQLATWISQFERCIEIIAFPGEIDYLFRRVTRSTLELIALPPAPPLPPPPRPTGPQGGRGADLGGGRRSPTHTYPALTSNSARYQFRSLSIQLIISVDSVKTLEYAISLSPINSLLGSNRPGLKLPSFVTLFSFHL